MVHQWGRLALQLPMRRLPLQLRGASFRLQTTTTKPPYYEKYAKETPAYWGRRMQLWDRLTEKHSSPTQEPIDVTFKGQVVSGSSYVTTPLSLAQGGAEGATGAAGAVVALVDGRVWDLHRPLEGPCKVDLVGFDHPMGQDTFWHSSAHVLGQALELYYLSRNWPEVVQVYLRDGPALDDGGFFYDLQILRGDKPVAVTPEEFQIIQGMCNAIIKARQPFERRVVSKAVAAEVLAENPLKVDLIRSLPEHEEVTLYRCGPLIDLCRGPHVAHTGMIKSLQVLKAAGNVSRDVAGKEVSMQRVYGIGFPTKDQMKEWKTSQELAAKIDHRVLGPAQGLFMFHPSSPGNAFMLPHGARIYHALMDHMRGHYRKHGYDEVVTPLLFHQSLWETSGHWQNYKDDMFTVHKGSKGCQHDHESEDDDVIGIKPMNCPSHCLIFASQTRSYRDLPIRYADFSPLHRNEASGSLTGLTRVRRFNQDDAHIFCRSDQLVQEMRACLGLVKEVYGVFGFTTHMRLSTRPDKYMGEKEVWDHAEGVLKTCLEDLGEPFTINEGDGAFYGPKIDIVLTDAFKRHHQCGTVQLDFQLPRRFELSYKGADGQQHQPVMIHRAVLGSVERMMAILTEHFHGRWPLWLSPRQVMVCPIADRHLDYATSVRDELHAAGFFVDVDTTGGSVKKQVRKAQVEQYNYILVVGDAEMEAKNVAVRTRDGTVHGSVSVTELQAQLEQAVRDHL